MKEQVLREFPSDPVEALAILSQLLLRYDKDIRLMEQQILKINGKVAEAERKVSEKTLKQRLEGLVDLDEDARRE